MKMHLLATALVAGALLGASGEPALGATCTGSVGGSVGTLVVPAGASCRADGAHVADDVIVRAGATLTAAGIAVGGDLVARAGSVVALTPPTSETAPPPDVRVKIDGGVLAVSAESIDIGPGRVAGGVTLRNVRGIRVVGLWIGGDVVIRGGDLRCRPDVTSHSCGSTGLTLRDNAVRGGVVVARTSMDGPTFPFGSGWWIDRNTVGRTVTLRKNYLPAAFPVPLVTANVIGGDLICVGNTSQLEDNSPNDPRPPNLVSGLKTGQCAGFR